LKDWHLPPCFDLLRRRLEADDRHGTRAFIRILRLLERHSLEQLTDAVEYALDLDVIDPESVRVILDYRADQPVELFSARWSPAPARRPRRDHRRECLPGFARGGDTMSTDPKSTVLLKHHLKALKLPTVLAECEKVALRCAAGNVDHLGFLLQLLELELIDRERKAADRRLKAARFPAPRRSTSSTSPLGPASTSPRSWIWLVVTT